jgi:hypothetical protein
MLKKSAFFADKGLLMYPQVHFILNAIALRNAFILLHLATSLVKKAR